MDAIVTPSKFERRLIAARWVNVCSQCERPLIKGRKGKPLVGVARFFCSPYCQHRYFGEPHGTDPIVLTEVPQATHEPFAAPTTVYARVTPQDHGDSPDWLEGIGGTDPEPSDASTRVYTRRETDEDYDGLVSRDGHLRIIKCRDDIQWIVQQLSGGRWRSKSYHRERLSMIRRYGSLPIILALPEHHDGSVDPTPHCKVCGLVKSKPTRALPRHMFCLAERAA